MNLTTLQEKFAQLPDALQQEALDFVEFLIHKYQAQDARSANSGSSSENRGGYGSWKGKIALSEDFDAPLDDMKEYM